VGGGKPLSGDLRFEAGDWRLKTEELATLPIGDWRLTAEGIATLLFQSQITNRKWGV
jgi:hypothetical protein